MIREDIAHIIKAYRAGKLDLHGERSLEEQIGTWPIKQYLGSNSLLDDDEVEAEYWLGVSQGLLVVDVGRPESILAYLRVRGKGAVKRYVSKTFSKGLVGKCCRCGAVQKKYHIKCTKCDGEMQYTQRRLKDNKIADMGDDGPLNHLFEIPGEDNSQVEEMDNRMVTDDFVRSFINYLGDCNAQRVFKLMVDPEVVNSDNYMQKIVKKLGTSCTQQNIARYVKSIKVKYQQFFKKTGKTFDGKRYLNI